MWALQYGKQAPHVGCNQTGAWRAITLIIEWRNEKGIKK
jgi:hypothetical protein